MLQQPGIKEDKTKNRLAEMKRRLSLQIQRIVEQKKKELEPLRKFSLKKYRDLHQIQCMKDVISQNGFFHEFELGKKIGEGCHSTVYKCVSNQQKKVYAVKMTKQKDLQLFSAIRECYRILKKLNNQNIIQAKNLFINQKNMTCYMVLEYCEWPDLQHYIKSQKLLDKAEISIIMTQIVKTIAYMHSEGVCHRDIKPDNILYDPLRKKIKIIDFDIARIKKFTHSQLELMTKTGHYSYRAPEIFHSIYSQQVDIWSAGVIAYEMLVGVLPFQSEFQEDQARKICNQEPDYSGLSVWEQELLQKMLCKDPKKRASANELLSSPFFFVHSKKILDNPSPTRRMIRSPSAGKEQFQKTLKSGWDFYNSNKSLDDEVTQMFLGNNQGDIGVIRCIGQSMDEKSSQSNQQN